ncbi:MAG: copper resistance protein CopC [Massilia sp.]
MSQFQYVFKSSLALVLMGAAALAQAHGKLTDSLPKADSLLDTTPSQIRLQFNESLEPAFSTLRLRDAHNALIPVTATARDQLHPDLLIATPPTLRSGKYKLEWSVVTHDGHKTKGAFSFAVK